MAIFFNKEALTQSSNPYEKLGALYNTVACSKDKQAVYLALQELGVDVEHESPKTLEKIQNLIRSVQEQPLVPIDPSDEGVSGVYKVGDKVAVWKHGPTRAVSALVRQLATLLGLGECIVPSIPCVAQLPDTHTETTIALWNGLEAETQDAVPNAVSESDTPTEDEESNTNSSDNESDCDAAHFFNLPTTKKTQTQAEPSSEGSDPSEDESDCGAAHFFGLDKEKTTPQPKPVSEGSDPSEDESDCEAAHFFGLPTKKTQAQAKPAPAEETTSVSPRATSAKTQRLALGILQGYVTPSREPFSKSQHTCALAQLLVTLLAAGSADIKSDAIVRVGEHLVSFDHDESFPVPSQETVFTDYCSAIDLPFLEEVREFLNNPLDEAIIEFLRATAFTWDISAIAERLAQQRIRFFDPKAEAAHKGSDLKDTGGVQQTLSDGSPSIRDRFRPTTNPIPLGPMLVEEQVTALKDRLTRLKTFLGATRIYSLMDLLSAIDPFYPDLVTAFEIQRAQEGTPFESLGTRELFPSTSNTKRRVPPAPLTDVVSSDEKTEGPATTPGGIHESPPSSEKKREETTDLVTTPGIKRQCALGSPFTVASREAVKGWSTDPTTTQVLVEALRRSSSRPAITPDIPATPDAQRGGNDSFFKRVSGGDAPSFQDMGVVLLQPEGGGSATPIPQDPAHSPKPQKPEPKTSPSKIPPFRNLCPDSFNA